MDDPREFFESLESRVDPAKAAGMTASYKFDIDGSGSWLVDVDDGKVTVTEDGGDADCTISTSTETFLKIANREQNTGQSNRCCNNAEKNECGLAAVVVACV